MQIKIFTIPALNSEAFTEEMNRFMRSVRVLDIENRLIENGSAHWSFCIKYLPANAGHQEGKFRESTADKKDFRNSLGEEVYGRFSKLRELRKKIAVQEAISAFLVFTDEELAKIAQLTDISLAGMRQKGVAEKKVAKYGEQFLALLQQILNPQAPTDETNRIFDTPHNGAG